MSHPTVSAVILAAGKGTRMGGDRAKVLYQVDGKALVQHVLDTCERIGIGQAVVVVGYQREEVEAAVAASGAAIAVQAEQLGTGHAVMQAKPAVSGDTVLVLCGDCPLTPGPLLDQLLRQHRTQGNVCTALAAELADPGSYGRMITDDQGRLRAIVEAKDASETQLAVRLINSGIYAFERQALFDALTQLSPDNAQGEYYLTDVVKYFVDHGQAVGLVTTEDEKAVLGVNTPEDLAVAEAYCAR